MNTQATFYILNDDNDAIENSLHYRACVLAADFYRQNQRVFIFTQDQTQAHGIDELLWAFEPMSFVPHNLLGEGPSYGSAVEISWQAPKNRRPILINLTSSVPHFANQFSQIIDFVPSDETLKQQARDRFRDCRQRGFQVDTQQVSEQNSPQVINS
ncbi:DNA polymerase III subunit chi [Colwelliaceae bacterium 6471]